VQTKLPDAHDGVKIANFRWKNEHIAPEDDFLDAALAFM
jgi:hypothetical protein